MTSRIESTHIFRRMDRFTTIRCQFGGTMLLEWITNKTIINFDIFPLRPIGRSDPSIQSAILNPIHPLWTLIFQWSFEWIKRENRSYLAAEQISFNFVEPLTAEGKELLIIVIVLERSVESLL